MTTTEDFVAIMRAYYSERGWDEAIVTSDSSVQYTWTKFGRIVRMIV